MSYIIDKSKETSDFLKTYQNSNYNTSLYHGTKSYVSLEFNNKDGTQTLVDVGYVISVEMNTVTNLNSETEIGNYGNPTLNSPSNIDNYATIKKYISDDIMAKQSSNIREGRDDGVSDRSGFFFSSITNFIDGDSSAQGELLNFNIIVYTRNDNNNLIITMEGCTIASIKRTLKADEFFVEEVTVKFKDIKQRIYPLTT